jgi:CDP-6-deoxy-D-xylo-4-hexulose-3-dehydrase
MTSDNWDECEIKSLKEVIDSGYFTMGEKVKDFENEFSKKFNSKFSIMVSSGSAANLVSFSSFLYKAKSLLKAGDEVIVPAVAWATTYYPLHQMGLRLKIVDIDLQTLNIDINKLKDAISSKTKAIVGVSILGNPAELNEIRNIADENNIYFFEDNCESLGAKLKGKYTGTFGDIGTFSFFYSHQISTMEGGMILTDDEEIYKLCKALRAHGWSRDLKEDSDKSLYEFIYPGYNVRPLELSAAAGLCQLKKLDDNIEKRRKNAEFFRSHFSNDKDFIIQKENDFSSSFSFTMILKRDSELNFNEVKEKLKTSGIEHRMITGGNIAKHPVINYFNYEIHSDLENANQLHDFGFFVGNHPRDLKDEISYLKEILSSVKGRN